MASTALKSWPKLSGPHICMAAGQRAMELARKGLLNAAELKGGSLTQTDIAAVFDFLAASQDLFDIYRSNYEACGQIHRRQPFVGANKDFFAMCVLRFLCFDVLRKTCAPQIKRADSDWEIEFLQVLTKYVCDTVSASFIEDLSKAYRRLAREHGTAITAMTIANDAEIRTRVKSAADGFPTEHIDFVNFSNAVNKALSDKYKDYGPSPIKVSEPVIEQFFHELRASSKGNFFRQLAFS